MVTDPATQRPHSDASAPSGEHRRASSASGIMAGAVPVRKRGRGVNIALGIVALAFAATIAYPWWQSTVRDENERGAIAYLKEIHRLEGEYKGKFINGQHRYAVTFFELAAAGLLEGTPPEGGNLTRGGYVFKLGTPGDAQARYFAIAHPEQPGVSGQRSFYIDDTGTVRASPGMPVGPAFPEEK